MTLRIQEYNRPESGVYGVFFVGGYEIGLADKVNGGWRLSRSRKVLTEEMAAKAMIDRLISEAHEDERLARSLLEALRLYCGGRLPSSGADSKPDRSGSRNC